MNYEEIIKKHELDLTTWTFKGFHGVLFTFYYIGYGPLKWCKNYYGEQCKKTMFFVKDDYVRWYWPDEDMRKLRKLLIKNVNNNPDYLKKLRQDWNEKLKSFDQLLKEISSKNLSLLTEEKLFKLYDEFLKKYMDHFGLVMAVQDAFSMYANEFLEPKFQKAIKEQNREKEFSELFATLLNPIEDSFISLGKKSLLKITQKVLEEGYSKKVNDLLIEHQKKFFWIRNNYAKQPILNVDFFKDEIKKLLQEKINPKQEIKRMNDELKHNIEKKKVLIKELKLSKELINLIKITESFSYIQDERKKYVLIANHYERLFIKELSKRKKLTEKQIEYAIYPECKFILDKKQLDLRKKGCLCIQDNKGYYIYEGSKVEQVHEKLFSTTSKQEITQLKGMCASKGKAQGKAKIIQKTHDLINFKKGDVLVSSMTRPEMISAMKKASAIVTDEGGVTSHAAIVSRELGIPCLLGTKKATLVFKDGDLLDVNANKGIVKKINK